jgi:hypothetical protein
MRALRLLPIFIAAIFAAACLNSPRPILVSDSGRVSSLRGITSIAVYSPDEADRLSLQRALAEARPDLLFMSADQAQVIVQFSVSSQRTCVDCGPESSPGPLSSQFAFAAVQRHDDREHCLPLQLSATWSHEAYTRRGLIRAFLNTLLPLIAR